VDDNEWVDVGEGEISIVTVHIEGDRTVLTTVDGTQPTDVDSEEDEDFVWDSEDDKDSEDVSLDEELGNSASEENEELEAEVEQRTELGAEIIDSDAYKDLVANKMQGL